MGIATTVKSPIGDPKLYYYYHRSMILTTVFVNVKLWLRGPPHGCACAVHMTISLTVLSSWQLPWREFTRFIWRMQHSSMRQPIFLTNPVDLNIKPITV